jgi:hypothetical protein
MYGAIEVAKTKKASALDNLEKYQKLETEYKAYEYYLDSVKRDGIPMDLVVKALPKIEAEINNVLNQIVDFNMVMNTDGKNINGYIIYDEDNFWPLELTSGMERFVSSLAIRIALINVSALPRPNFIAIDEGWGSLDAEHISAVVNLFDYFRTKFDFSIIISHVDSMRDMVDNLIEVNKQTRKPASLNKLTIGVKCGGSDGFSGISANPAVGYCADLLVALGGKVLLAEFPELCGVEQELIDRTIDPAAANKFIHLMKSYSESALQVGSGFHMNPSPGNIKDGLITDAIKSAGAAKKGGNSPIVD